MTENESMPPSPPESAPAPQAGSGKKRRLFRHLLSIALLIGLGSAAVLYSTKLNFPSPEAPQAPELTAYEQRLNDLESRLNALDEKVAAPQAVADTTAFSEAIKKIDDRLVQAENKGVQDTQRTQKAIAAAFAFRDLRDAAKEGRNFASELAALRVATVDDRTLAELETKLDPFAVVTPPTLPQLREALTVEEKATPVEADQEKPVSWWERLKAAFRPLVSVRPLHDLRYAGLEKALDSGNAPAALEAAKALPDDARKNLAAWQAKLEARIALDAALQEIAAHFSASSQPPMQGNAP